MRFTPIAAAGMILGVSACGSAPTTPSSGTTPSAPDLSGIAAQVTHTSGHSPGGYISQYDVWLTTPPDSVPSAGIVSGRATQVFIVGTTVGGAGTDTTTATAADIAVGDQIEIWRNTVEVFGAEQAPPGAPAYDALKVVIVRNNNRIPEASTR